MSTAMMLHEGAQAVLAQVGNPTPEAPPAADAGLQASRWGFWALLIGLPLAAIGVVVVVLLRVSNSDRRRAPAQQGWAAPGQSPGWNAPGPQPVPPPGPHPGPSGWNAQQQAPGAWGPNGAAPAPPGWDRPPVTTNPPGH